MPSYKLPVSQVVHKFGRNNDIDIGTEDIWRVGGLIVWQTTDQTLSIVSDSANDTADGTGARSVTVIGLDGSLAEVSETINLNGAGAVTTTQKFLRVYRAYVSSAGTYAGTTAGGNLGNINGTYSGTGNPAFIIAHDGTRGFGQTQSAFYTIPAGYLGYIAGIDIQVDATKPLTIQMWRREQATTVTAPVQSRRLLLFWDGAAGDVEYRPVAPMGPYSAGTDIWFSATSANNNATCTVNFEIWLVRLDASYHPFPVMWD